MNVQRLWLVGLVLAGLALAVVALRSPDPTYAAPRPLRPVQVPRALTQAPLPGNVERSFDVEGICCQGCGGKLGAALLALDGVQEVAVDPVLGRVMALAPADLDPQRLASTLTFGAYVARPR